MVANAWEAGRHLPLPVNEGDYKSVNLKCSTAHHEPRDREGFAGFTLIELLVVIAVIGILAGLLLPALAKVKDSGQRVTCVNNLRQLALSMSLYASDHNGSFPGRGTSSRWPSQLYGSYGALHILLCPSAVMGTNGPPAPVKGSPTDNAPRNYIQNGFSDFFLQEFPPADWPGILKGGLYLAMRETSIDLPTETIVFGEQRPESGKFYVDILPVNEDYLNDLEESRHPKSSQRAKSGSSNYSFADGGVRPLRFGKSTCPVNLWAVTGGARTNAALCRPR
jgi:prepilin-type N-terminal cleavage/methylation domain-containing protein/prepilin-type processing-associated H-X9-DG protein